jgi:hypothetical protein
MVSSIITEFDTKKARFIKRIDKLAYLQEDIDFKRQMIAETLKQQDAERQPLLK